VIQLACSTDLRFAPDCAVMLSSLMATNPPESLHVHLLRDEALPPEAAGALSELVTKPGGRCDVIEVPTDRGRHWPASGRFPAAAWYRVRLAELLPDHLRILYVDSDVMFVAPVDELWATELDDCVIAAVTQYLYPAMVPRVARELDLPDVSGYFNSGVLLMDLERWRSQEITTAIADYGRSHHLVWPDQDSLSGVLHSRRLPLHPRWNAMPGIWEMPRRVLPYSEDQVREAAENPAIVHFLGPHKPWHHRCRSSFRDQWFSYLKNTPWRDREIEGRTAGQTLLRSLPPLWAYNVEVALERWPIILRTRDRLRDAVDRTRA
jgi:lipopolysaccharide biosynthesis glycosyltransferase